MESNFQKLTSPAASASASSADLVSTVGSASSSASPGKRHIILLGNSGAGKSYICNLLCKGERVARDTIVIVKNVEKVLKAGQVISDDIFESDDGAGAVTLVHSKIEFERFILSDTPGLIEHDIDKVKRNAEEIEKALTGTKNAVLLFVAQSHRVNGNDEEALKVLSEAYLYENSSLMILFNKASKNFPSKFPTIKKYWIDMVFACSFYNYVRFDQEDIDLVKTELLEMTGTNISKSGKKIELHEEKLKNQIKEQDAKYKAEFKIIEDALAKEKKEREDLDDTNKKLIAAGKSEKGLILRVVLSGPMDITQTNERTVQTSTKFRFEQFNSVRNIIKTGAEATATIAKIITLGFSGSTETEYYRYSKSESEFSSTTTETESVKISRRLESGEYIIQITEVCGFVLNGVKSLIPLSSSLHYVNNEKFNNFAKEIYHDADAGIFTSYGKERLIRPLEVYQPADPWSRILYHGRQDRQMFIRRDYRINVPWDFLSTTEMNRRCKCDNNSYLGGHRFNGDGGVDSGWQCNGHYYLFFEPTLNDV